VSRAESQPLPRRKIYTVSELTREIKKQLEGEFYDVWVAGELSNFKSHSSGHYYFTLKDERSQLAAVMFRSDNRTLKFRPADGLMVLARGFITLYEPQGKYQLQVAQLEPRGKGALQLAFEQLKEKLAREGLFAPERKRPLPQLPKRIGIVTSPSGAAIRDICRILHRRFPNLEVLLYPAQVQGDLAAFEIATGVQVLNRLGGFDVLIVGRGGGSMEDLQPFNEESVARAIASSKIPVISAVGHETDFTIADFVADVRAPTPSAAAEMVVARKEDMAERVENLGRRLEDGLRFRLQSLSGRVARLTEHRSFLAVRHQVVLRAQQADEALLRCHSLLERRLGDASRELVSLRHRLEAFRLDRRVAETQTRLDHLQVLLEARVRAGLTAARQRLGEDGARLSALSPLAVLGRGYSLTWDATGRLLRDASAARPGDALRVTLHRGELDCRVETSRPAREGEDHERETEGL
jgi:exodeoxyribonuclease VII large subunit